MRKRGYSIVKNEAGSIPEILIYGIIGATYWEIGAEAKYFKQDLDWLAKSNPRINVRINCPGGSTWDGIAMVTAIRACVADVHTYNDGIAFSMAGVLLLSGKTVHVAKGSLTMLHATSSGGDGNAEELREAAIMLDKHDESLIALIAGRTGKTEEEVKTLWMDYKDHYITAKEMIELGLADVLEDYDAKDTPADPQNMSRDQVMAFYQDKFSEPSEALITKITAQVKNLLSTQNSNMKNFGKIMALAVAGGQTVSDAVLAEANAALTENGITGYGIYPESLVTDAAVQTADNLRLTSEVTALTTRATTAEATLATANTEITNLKLKVAAFAKNAGATHIPEGGEDIQPENEEKVDWEAVTSNMAHNRAADALGL